MYIKYIYLNHFINILVFMQLYYIPHIMLQVILLHISQVILYPIGCNTIVYNFYGKGNA